MFWSGPALYWATWHSLACDNWGLPWDLVQHPGCVTTSSGHERPLSCTTQPWSAWSVCGLCWNDSENKHNSLLSCKSCYRQRQYMCVCAGLVYAAYNSGCNNLQSFWLNILHKTSGNWKYYTKLQGTNVLFTLQQVSSDQPARPYWVVPVSSSCQPGHTQ